MVRRLMGAASGALLLSLSVGWGPAAQAEVVAPAPGPGPVVSGPVTGGNGAPVLFGHTAFDLASVGYTQSEYFVEGTARAYTPAAPLTSDGRWALTATSTAPYRTRIVVNRPAQRRDFNGSVIVEWLNVSGGADASPDWIHTHNELIREGYAWVGVSAQAVGLNALKTSTTTGDPVRYASLDHPGDSYSYDLFSQAGRAVRDHGRTVLGGLRPDRVIAVGESQSAGRLVTYIDAVHPLAQVYDGYLVHSRSAGGAPVSQPPLPAVPTPVPTLLRDDLDVPVLVFTAETDVGALQSRQPDSPTYRLWEATGTAHFDLYGLTQGATDRGDRATVEAWFASMQHPTNQPSPNFTCDVPINSGPQTFVLRAAVAALDRWVAHGTPPPRAPRFETVTVQPARYALDADGNVRGGIRTPAVDAPVAVLSGLGQTGGTPFCQLFGSTVPFPDEQLRTLYRDHGGFVAAWSRATLRSLGAGFLRPADALDLLVAGARSDVLR